MKDYLKYNEPEAFQRIARALNKQCCLDYEGYECWLIDDKQPTVEFNPLTNAEQWIECMTWYRIELLKKCNNSGELHSAAIVFTNATHSRETLLVDMLNLLNSDNSKRPD